MRVPLLGAMNQGKGSRTQDAQDFCLHEVAADDHSNVESLIKIGLVKT
jgi:hypothetical protein